MGYFDKKKNVDDYIKLADGYDGRELVKVLNNYLLKNSTVLELGMGPGKDLDMLSKTYKATGSDTSKIFIVRYKKKDNRADLIMLDAVTMNTNRKFDCIYSNKVLHHLTKEELKISFFYQMKVLNNGGILFHSFWHGDKTEEYDGLLFTYYTENELETIVDKYYSVLEIKRYKEMEDDDSFYVVLQKQ
jgi:cyclopropane fatty-acyl-phospholipid synthase-like methyltransferase